MSNADLLHTGTSNITIKSGTVVGNIAGDGVSTNTVGIDGKVQITFEGGIIKGNVWGVTEGFYNDDGTLDIFIAGGDFTDCKGINVSDGTLSKGDVTKYGTKLPATATVTINYDELSAASAAAVNQKIAGGFNIITLGTQKTV